MALHPDRHDGCDVKLEEVKVLNEAYDTIGDHSKRSDYDRDMGFSFGHFHKNIKTPVSNYRKVYTARPPPGFKTFDSQRHYEMHYGDGMMMEEIEKVRKRYLQASKKFGVSEYEEGYQSPLGRGFTFEGWKSSDANPFSKKPQGPKANKAGRRQEVKIEYEESFLHSLNSSNLNKADRYASRSEVIRARADKRRNHRRRNRGDRPVGSEDDSGCTVM